MVRNAQGDGRGGAAVWLIAALAAIANDLSCLNPFPPPPPSCPSLPASLRQSVPFQMVSYIN